MTTTTDTWAARHSLIVALEALAAATAQVQRAAFTLPALTDDDRAAHAGCMFRIITEGLSESTRFVLDGNEAHPDMQDVESSGPAYLYDHDHGLAFSVPDDTEWK